VILSAGYALWLYRRVVFGVAGEGKPEGHADLSGREKAILYPLIALTILFGIYPVPILDVTAASVDALVNSYRLQTPPAPISRCRSTELRRLQDLTDQRYSLRRPSAAIPEILLALSPWRC
jgi:hypothetical protein